MTKKILVLTQTLSDILFLVVLPLIFLYSWINYLIKKIFKLMPKILISPLGEPMAFFSAKAAKTSGYQADIFAFDCQRHFRNLCEGFILNDHPVLKYLIIISDYLLPFIWASLKYDVFEFPFSGGILMYSRLRRLELFLLKILAKKIIVYGYGSDCLLLGKIRKSHRYNLAMDLNQDLEKQYDQKVIRENIARAQKYANVLIGAAYLNYLGPKAVMLPIAFDVSGWNYSAPKKSKIITIIHSTNHRVFKGSRFILAAVKKLQKEGWPIKLLLIENRTLKECQKLYRKGDFFITDVIIGWYGFTACEAMSLGRPVICYLKDDLRKANNLVENIPIVSANPDNLKTAIITLVKDYDLRKKLASEGRKYVLRYHSLESSGRFKATIYQKVWLNQKINQNILKLELKKEI